MSRRQDTERIFKELEEIREALNDPTIGLGAFHQDQDQLRRKILENVQQGTAGLREENRELRRRQERMLSDLGDTRTAVEALRREIAQAWAHTLGVPRPVTPDDRIRIVLPEHEPQPLGAGSDNEEPHRWGEEEVAEVTDADPADEGSDRHDDQSGTNDPPAEAFAVPEPDVASVDANSTEAPNAVVPEGAPTGHDETASDIELRESRRAEERGKHLRGLLTAAAISSVRLICHKDTWAFLLEQTSRHQHFRLPDRVTDLEDGRIETFVSGRSLLAVLVTTREILDDHGPDTDMVTWALASAVYSRTHLAIENATVNRPDDSEVTTIVLDDRPGRPVQGSAA
ncbi:hypothetical protein ABT075_41060 [Streptomyces sp. NPDC002677]|uniref:hypothetical protein n=1 Tax=Streptomyces sp. NPDC002677 TaxID=3154774 RepID=UPI0033326C59